MARVGPQRHRKKIKVILSLNIHFMLIVYLVWRSAVYIYLVAQKGTDFKLYEFLFNSMSLPPPLNFSK